MSTQYRLVQSGKTASGGCSAGPRFVRACSATDLFIYFYFLLLRMWKKSRMTYFNVLVQYLSRSTGGNYEKYLIMIADLQFDVLRM
jgi:hypothetical protein